MRALFLAATAAFSAACSSTPAPTLRTRALPDNGRAWYYAGFEWLERGRTQNVFSKQMLDREPLLASLRADQRFAELRARMP